MDKKNEKNGFTLVELLAVIAILAILVIIALPNVLKMFNNAKKNTFMTEARKTMSAAETQYVTNQMKGITMTTYSNDSSLCDSGFTSCELDLSGRSNFNYLIKTNSKGKVVYFSFNDDSYVVEMGDMVNEIKAADIDSSDVDSIASSSVTTKTCSDGSIAGDANGDGKVDSSDMIALQKYIADESSTIKGGDYNSDGKIDSIDLIRLKKYIAGYGVELGCGTASTGATVKTCSDGSIAGDANGDGKVDSSDLDLLNKYIAGSTDSIKGGDYNSDGTIDVLDTIRLKKYLNNTNVELGCGTASKPQTPKTCSDGSLAGDVNGDGKVDSSDLNLLKSHIADDSVEIKCGDFNSDGAIDVTDITRLQKYLQGSDVDLACSAKSEGTKKCTDGSIAGDVNGDGKVNSDDVTALQKIISTDSTSKEKYDFNSDGSVNSIDLIRLKKYVNGYNVDLSC